MLNQKQEIRLTAQERLSGEVIIKYHFFINVKSL